MAIGSKQGIRDREIDRIKAIEGVKERGTRGGIQRAILG